MKALHRVWVLLAVGAVLNSAAISEAQNLGGRWLVRISLLDAVDFQRWTLQESPDGRLFGSASDRLLGPMTIIGEIMPSGEIRIELQRDGPGWTSRIWEGQIVGEMLTGDGEWRGGEKWSWTAERIADSDWLPSAHSYTPQQFSTTFSASVPPALRIAPGDTVRTFTIDVAGQDASGTRRSFNGPLTGPIYIEGAIPGDVIAVHLTRVRTNKSTGFTHGLFHPFAVTASFNERQNKDHPIVEWLIDPDRGVVTLKEPRENLGNLEIPLRPMVGMIGVAPPGDMAVGPNILGPWGGNLDYNRIEEGVTVFLPVLQPGALLYLGDGHAAQGDGEISGAGIETSLDVELVVGLISGRSISTPRVETSEELISVGSGGSLEAAMQMAISDLAQWLTDEYGLTSSDAALLLGQAIRLDIAQVVGRDRTIGASIPKRLLPRMLGSTR
jgi:amidase